MGKCEGEISRQDTHCVCGTTWGGREKKKKKKKKLKVGGVYKARLESVKRSLDTHMPSMWNMTHFGCQTKV